MEGSVPGEIASEQHGARDGDAGCSVPVESADQHSGEGNPIVDAAAACFRHSKGFDDVEACFFCAGAQSRIQTRSADQNGVKFRHCLKDLASSIEARCQLGGDQGQIARKFGVGGSTCNGRKQILRVESVGAVHDLRRNLCGCRAHEDLSARNVVRGKSEDPASGTSQCGMRGLDRGQESLDGKSN